ncbi:MAG: hypothetical protein M1370_10765 [Bacteroidetes bacterium]|nr:hypothetical protein [Bacteroidota bacterium]
MNILRRQGFRQSLVILFLVAMVVAFPVAPSPALAQSAEVDWDIPGGHFFTQTAVPGRSGYAITDSDAVLFWTWFQGFGGADAVGYPVSHRFQCGGFVCQAMQKVIFQWRPEAAAVAFVNVFDVMYEAGKDDWLQSVKQTPRMANWSKDKGKTWEQIVKDHESLLDTNPTIKAVYLSARNPLASFGLPMSPVTDMGNNYAVRFQRVIAQQWKKDVPWARTGDVTIANGGDLAKEAGLIPLAAATPVAAVTQPTTAGDYRRYVDPDFGFSILYPQGWEFSERRDENSATVTFWQRRSEAGISPRISVETHPTGDSLDSITASIKRNQTGILWWREREGTFQGLPALMITAEYEASNKVTVGLLGYVVIRDGRGYFLRASSSVQTIESHKDDFTTFISGFQFR